MEWCERRQRFGVQRVNVARILVGIILKCTLTLFHIKCVQTLIITSEFTLWQLLALCKRWQHPFDCLTIIDRMLSRRFLFGE